jgi:hypothetical protein
MIKEKKEKPRKKKEDASDVHTPPPPQDMNPSKNPVQENAGHEMEQRPGKLSVDPVEKEKKEEKPKLLGDPTEIDDETTI